MRLNEKFFRRSAVDVARDLIGRTLVHGERRGVIIETEAYLTKGDLASHHAQGRKPALDAFSRGPGAIYIHHIHGWACMDIVAGDGSVLIRALDLQGALGPNRLMRAMEITEKFHMSSVTEPDSQIWFDDVGADYVVHSSARIGVKSSKDLPFRFCIIRN